MRFIFLAIALLMGALCMTTGCATSITDRGDISSLSDADIVSDIQDRLRADPVTMNQTFGVACDAGVVTLTGSVKSSQARATALNIAAGTPGVVEVVDRMYR